MRESSFCIFLTFVLWFSGPLESLAAPQENSVPQISGESLKNIEDPQLSAAAVLGAQNPQSAVSLHWNWLAGHVNKKIGTKSQTGFGLSFSHKKNEVEMWDLQGSWLSSRVAWLQLGQKFLITDSLYSPYYRLALSHFADPDDALAGIMRIDSFKGTAAVGVLDLAQLGEIWTLELGAHFGISGLAFHIQSGLQWTF